MEQILQEIYTLYMTFPGQNKYTTYCKTMSKLFERKSNIPNYPICSQSSFIIDT